MRKKWMNLILRVTVLINNKKQALLSSHAFMSILNVFLIVFLEIFLFFISIPLYLVSKDIGAGTQVQYKIRRVLSLTVLLGILFVWLVKLLFIIGVPLYYDTQQAFFISDIQSGTLLASNYLAPNAYSSSTSSVMTTPRIVDVERLESGSILISGVGESQTDIVAMIGGDAFEGTKFYIDRVDPFGFWEVTTQGESLRILPGEYWLQVMTYDNALQTKSELSPAYTFNIESSWYSGVVDVLDVFLNYAVLVFLVIGLFLIILLI